MRYYQGPGALRKISASLLTDLGGRPFVFGGRNALASLERHGFHQAISDQGLKPVFEIFQGECCKEEVKRLSDIALDASSNLVVGAGGGKALDAAKAVGAELNLPIM